MDDGARAFAVGVGVDEGVAAVVVGAAAGALEVSGNAWVSVCSAGPVRVAPRAEDVNAIAATVTAHSAIAIERARMSLGGIHAPPSRLTAAAVRATRTMRGSSDRRRYDPAGCLTLGLPPRGLHSHTDPGHRNSID